MRVGETAQVGRALLLGGGRVRDRVRDRVRGRVRGRVTGTVRAAPISPTSPLHLAHFSPCLVVRLPVDVLRRVPVALVLVPYDQVVPLSRGDVIGAVPPATQMNQSAAAHLG